MTAWRQSLRRLLLRVVGPQRLSRFPEVKEQLKNEFSFSQSGEDRIVRYLFTTLGRELSSIRYVDLGAAHPVGDSNTYLFYLYGGSGLLVEADPRYQEATVRARPRDRYECVAVVPREDVGDETVTFHRLQEKGWSTVSTTQVDHAIAAGKALDEHETFDVPCTEINGLLSRHFGEAPIDLLSIDLENLDTPVLAELDFNRFRPSVVIAETLFALPGEITIAAILRNHGYTKYAETRVNTIFVSTALLATEVL